MNINSAALHEAAEAEPVEVSTLKGVISAWVREPDTCVSPTGAGVSEHGLNCPDWVRSVKRQRKDLGSVMVRCLDGRIVFFEGTDIGRAVAWAEGFAKSPDYFVGVVSGNEAGKGEERLGLEDWVLRRCARCARRCLVRIGVEICLACGPEEEDS